jgi:hypothetical protein
LLIFNKGPVHYKEKVPRPQPQPEPAKETLALEYMEHDRLLKHEVPVYFYKYKEKKEHQGEGVKEPPPTDNDTGK